MSLLRSTVLRCAIYLILLAFAGTCVVARPRAIQTPQAAEGPKAVDDSVVKIFELKNVTPSQLRSILSVYPAQISEGYTGRASVLSVKTSRPVMDAIEETIKRLDVPPPPPPPPSPTPEQKVAELVIYVIAPTDTVANNTLPSALKPVLDQINSLFGYKGFQLLDTLLVRAPARRPGESPSQASASGTLPIPGPAVSTYTFNANFSLRTTESAQSYLFLERMGFSVKVPRVPNPTTPEMFYTVGVNSDVEIKPGQQVVVGKTQAGSISLILVMSARFMDSATAGGNR